MFIFATDRLSASDCDCPVQCEKIKYGLQLSSAYFPSPHFWGTLYKLFNESNNRAATDTLQELIRLEVILFKSFVTREMRPKIISCINTGSKISTLTTASSCCFFLCVFRSSFRFSKKEETVRKLPCVLSKFQVIYVHSNTMLTDNFIGEC